MICEIKFNHKLIYLVLLGVTCFTEPSVKYTSFLPSV